MFRKLICIISFVAVLGLGLSIPAKAADPDLVGYWSFDEGAGTTAFDSSGNGNDGVFVGDPQWVPGKLGGALEFNGDDYLDCGNNPSLEIRDQITIAFWFQVEAFQTTWEAFLSKGDTAYRASRGGGDGNGTHFGISGTSAGGGNGHFNGPTVITGGDWHHFAGTYDGATGRIYIDGVLDAETPATGQINIEPENFWIGNNSQNTGRLLHGLMDDVRLYSRALTEDEINFIMAGGGAEYPLAAGPSPEDGALLTQTWVTLTWRAGDFAVSHDVYLSDNFDDVNSGAEAAFQGNKALTDTMQIVGFFGFPLPDGLVPGTTYYWKINEVNDADPNSPWIGDIWSFTVPSKKAYDPAPLDAAKYVFTDAELSWTGGFGSQLHTVYFGDDFDTVANASGGALISETTFDPGTLEKDTTYYWRVDEFEAPFTHKGNVWSFSTIPDIPITDPNLVGWWKFDEGAGTVAVDSSGHDNHSELRGDPTWVEGIDGGALEFDGSGDYVDCGNTSSLCPTTELSVMAWIKVNPWTKTWETILAKGDNSYRLARSGSGNATHFGCGGTSGNNFDGSTVVTDNQWHHVCGVYDGATQTIYIDGVLDTAIPSTGNVTASTYSLFIGENSQSTGRHMTGLIDDVRLYNKGLTLEEIMEVMRGDTTVAGSPSPRSGALIDVKAATALTWQPGDNAVQQDVYLATDRTAVEDADATDTTGVYRGRQAGTSFTPAEGLPWGTGPYFWRVDQVNNDGTIGTGRIWSFTVADFLIVDDFESYTDDDAAGEAIWQTWLDGFGVNTNGSECAYTLPPYAEQTIVHSGTQSMPLHYNNTGGVLNSEVSLKLGSPPRNWTDEGVGELSIWFQGRAASTGSFVEGPVGTFTMTGSGADIWNNGPAGNRHDEFHFAYKTLTGAGTIIAKVNSLERTHAWAKAGVMIRETLEGGSRHAFGCVTPDNGVASQGRMDPGADSFNTAEGGITAPYWVKLERDLAGTFTVSHSADGSSWAPVAGALAENIQMGATVFVGLALTSHDAALTTEAVFSNVQIIGNVTGMWQHQDIGIASNAAEPMYVAVSNATGASAVVAHTDPAAPNVDTWTEWVIPLSEFSDKGINLNDVDKIAIGLGSGSGTAGPGGSGIVFIDDIRLYRPRP